MKRSIGRWCLAAILPVSLAIPASAAPKPAAKPTVTIRTAEQAIGLLVSAQGESLEVATAWLSARPDLLPKQAKALAAAVGKAPASVEVASRVLDLVIGRDDACPFVASLLDTAHPGWMGALMARGMGIPRCPPMSDALARLLKTLPDTAKDATAERPTRWVLEYARTAKDPAAARTACRAVLSGTDTVRHEALVTILAARPPEAAECLVQAYAEEAGRKENGAALRAELLDGVVAVAGAESVPTLRLALERPEDRDQACTLLQARGPAALEGLIFAVRTGDARSEGVNACLAAMGVAALPGVIPLVDHPSPRIRAFAIDFLGRFRSPEARDALQKRFLAGGGPVDRSVLLGLLAAYPAAEVGETLREALSSEDPQMRRAGLDAVESSRALNLVSMLHEIAEEDPVPAMRRRALEVAWRLDDLTILPLARRMATYEEPLVATMAIRVLGFLGGKDDAPVVGKLLAHKEPDIEGAAREAAWLLGLQAPKKDEVEYASAPKVKEPKSREVSCDGLAVKVVGRKGPSIVVLPGGPGMDLTWAWPVLADLGDDAVVAFVAPLPAEYGPAGAGLVQAGHVQCVREALGGGPVVLVSHGLGGTWALSLAAALPDAVAGVVALMSPLPTRLVDMDDALRAALKEPLLSLASSVVEAQARFTPAALDKAFARLFAPAMAGRSDPAETLRVAWDVVREGRAASLLERPEVRFVPAETKARYLLIVPPGLPQAATDAYVAVATSAPGRVEALSWDGCGFLPEVACTSKAIKAITGFAKTAVTGAGR